MTPQEKAKELIDKFLMEVREARIGTVTTLDSYEHLLLLNNAH